MVCVRSGMLLLLLLLLLYPPGRYISGAQPQRVWHLVVRDLHLLMHLRTPVVHLTMRNKRSAAATSVRVKPPVSASSCPGILELGPCNLRGYITKPPVLAVTHVAEVHRVP
jgi:hypothetical protein